jgi:hypothetical protein
MLNLAFKTLGRRDGYLRHEKSFSAPQFQSEEDWREGIAGEQRAPQPEHGYSHLYGEVKEIARYEPDLYSHQF